MQSRIATCIDRIDRGFDSIGGQTQQPPMQEAQYIEEKVTEPQQFSSTICEEDDDMVVVTFEPMDNFI